MNRSDTTVGSEKDQQFLTYKLAGKRLIHRLGYGGMQLTGPGVWGDAPNRSSAITVLRSAVESGESRVP